MADVPDKFEGGVEKQREKLNKMIEWMKEAEERLKKLEKGSPLTVCVHDAANNNIIKIKIRDAEQIEVIGPIDCDCVSGQAGGGPDD
jgi:hypothetical protein